MLYTSVNANEVLPQVHIALVLAFALIETILEVHEVGKTLFVQALFETGLLLSFSVGGLFDTFLELLVKAIVSSFPQELLLMAIKILYLLLKAYNYVVILIYGKQLGLELIYIVLHVFLLRTYYKIINYLKLNLKIV